MKDGGGVHHVCLSVCLSIQVFHLHLLIQKPFDLGTWNFTQIVPAARRDALLFVGHMGQSLGNISLKLISMH